MAIFMTIVAVLAWAVSALTIMSANSVMHEIFGAVVGVGGCVMFAGAAILEAIQKLHPPKAGKPSEFEQGG